MPLSICDTCMEHFSNSASFCETCRAKHDTIESLKAKVEILEEEVQYYKNRSLKEMEAKREAITERELILQEMVNVVANLERMDSFRRMQGFGGGFIK